MAPRKVCAGALVRAAHVALDNPGVEIDLQLVDAAVDLLAEDNPMELVEHGLVEALDDTACSLVLAFLRLWSVFLIRLT